MLPGSPENYAFRSSRHESIFISHRPPMQIKSNHPPGMPDKISGSKSERPGLTDCLSKLQPGDTLLVWRLDRLGRSVRHLLDLVEDLRKRGVGIKSICDGAIDTTTASGELVFHIFTPWRSSSGG